MTLTNNSELFSSVHEDAINNVAKHIMRQRPSLFNYGTAYIAARPELLCERIDFDPAVIQRGNPLITIEDPLPVLGTNGLLALNFCFQLTKVEIDFYPGRGITLPSELNPPLAQQKFSLHVRVCGGIGCPSDTVKEWIPPIEKQKDITVTVPDTIIPTPKKMECFCLDLFAVGHIEVTGPIGNQKLSGKVDGIEIVDVKPEGLENSIECYLNLLIQLVILPKTSIALENVVFGILDLATITLSPSPTSTSIPHNPAIEDDRLKVFIDMVVTP
jgi:hypothetical protein